MTEEFLELVHVDRAVDMLVAGLDGEPVSTEEIEATAAVGRIIGSDVVAGDDVPGFARSEMDGFAVRASDTFGATDGLPAYLALSGEVPMGAATDLEVKAGAALRISTGGVMPEGADAVVMVENTEVEGQTIEVVKGVAAGENVIRADEDIPAGTVVLAKGEVVGPAQVGALAALGIGTVGVFRKPVVGIISTGNELVGVEEDPKPGQVRDVNSSALKAAAESIGCEATIHGIVRDEPDMLLGAARSAIKDSDVVIISGGSSMGVRDVTEEVLRGLGSPGVLAHGIYLKPGKPTLLAVCDGKPVMGLPGNPASALVVFREVLAPVLSFLKGEERALLRPPPRTVEAVIGRSVASATGRLDLVPVRLEAGQDGLVAVPVMGRANLIGTLAKARGQVRIPEGSEGLEQGRRVTVELLE
jgi:molybdopterin molybdotransferase